MFQHRSISFIMRTLGHVVHLLYLFRIINVSKLTFIVIQVESLELVVEDVIGQSENIAMRNIQNCQLPAA